MSTIARTYISRRLSAPAPLRVVMFTGDFYPEQIGGQGIYAFEIATRAAALGLDVTVVCPATPGRVAFRCPEGVRVRLLETSANAIAYAARLETIRREVVSTAQVLHVNELFGLTAALSLPRERGLVISSHNAYLDRFHAARGVKKLMYLPLIGLEALGYPRADRLLIGSEIEREPALKLGVANEKIITIPYGVDATRFADEAGTRRATTRARFGISEGAQVAVFVGRFVERKKPLVVARAFKELAARDPNFHGILVGDGDMTEPVRALLRGERRVHLAGAVSFTDLPEYYAAADVFTLPSVGEGSISLAVLEAAAAGLGLVLTADSAGQSAVFEPGKNGEMVLLDDSRDLARGLERSLARHLEYGARSRELIALHFSWDACARQTVIRYEESFTESLTRSNRAR